MNEVMDHEVMEPPAKRACQQLDHIIETGISVSCLPRSVAVGRCGWQVSLNGHNSQPLAQSNGNFQNFAPGHWVQRSNRRATCGLYMPTYGGYENLRGEILTVTIDKRRRPSLGLDILVVHCGGGNVKAVIQSVQHDGAANLYPCLCPGVQVLSIDHVSLKDMDQVAVDHQLDAAYNKSNALHMELVLHLTREPATYGTCTGCL